MTPNQSNNKRYSNVSSLEPIATILIPAHNEESVIGRTLAGLFKDARPGEFDVVVICNGCTDGTAALVRNGFPQVRLFELQKGNKTAALNKGIEVTRYMPVIFLDADISVRTDAVRSLVTTANDPGVEAVIGTMDMDLGGCPWLVRAFYRVWLRHPYLSSGKFAAFFALSRSGLRHLNRFPDITSDDTYLRRLIPVEHVRHLNDVRFLVHAPRTLSALLNIRARVYRGNRELNDIFDSDSSSASGEAIGLINTVIGQPALWPSAVVYLFIAITAKLLSTTRAYMGWTRDETSRQTAKFDGAERS